MARALFTPPSAFDSQLYDRIITMYFDVDQASSDCGTPAMQAQILVINRESKQLLRYTQYADKDLNASITLVDKAVSEMVNIYQVGKPSTAYCKIKLEIVDNELDVILTGYGGKNK